MCSCVVGYKFTNTCDKHVTSPQLETKCFFKASVSLYQSTCCQLTENYSFIESLGWEQSWSVALYALFIEVFWVIKYEVLYSKLVTNSTYVQPNK